MKENKKNINDSVSFLRYRGNHLSGNEKNRFERELQKDPFASDADDGFSMLKGNELSDDLASLSKKLKQRTSRYRVTVIYRLAASVAILAAISTILLLLNRTPESNIPENKPELTVATPAMQNKQDAADKSIETTDIRKQIAEYKPEKKEEKNNQNITLTKNSEEIHGLKEDIIVRDSARSRHSDLTGAVNIIANQPEMAKITPVTRSLQTSPEKKNEIKGKITASDDGSPLPGVNIVIKGTNLGTVSDEKGEFRLSLPGKDEIRIVASSIGMVSQEITAKPDSTININLESDHLALQEVVVTGYGQKKTRAAADESESGYTAPEPEYGSSKFQAYIQNNIQYPDEQRKDTREVVVLKFIVRLDGIPDSIEVIKSPGKAYTDEAIRLLKEGPVWKPASENGLPVVREGRVRIVFKK